MAGPSRETLKAEIEATASRLRWMQHQLEHGTCADVGHDWQSIGGCNCGCFPDAVCSVAVMQCTRCGDCDYGDSPQADEQRASCQDHANFRDEQEALKAEDGRHG